jgi:hypothetical protein
MGAADMPAFRNRLKAQAGLPGIVTKQVARSKHPVIPDPLEFHCLKWAGQRSSLLPDAQHHVTQRSEQRTIGSPFARVTVTACRSGLFIARITNQSALSRCDTAGVGCPLHSVSALPSARSRSHHCSISLRAPLLGTSCAACFQCFMKRLKIGLAQRLADVLGLAPARLEPANRVIVREGVAQGVTHLNVVKIRRGQLQQRVAKVLYFMCRRFGLRATGASP